MTSGHRVIGVPVGAAIGTPALECGLSLYTLDEHFKLMPGMKLYPGAGRSCLL